jgi:pyridoxamine 5'-phosphate oxidase
MAEQINTVTINGIKLGLAEVEQDCWLRLLNGALKTKEPFHNPVVGTNSNGKVSMRTVVLRQVITTKRQLYFHTDVRSGKLNDVEVDNNISWLFYDAAARMQIRIAGTTCIHKENELADSAWHKISNEGRKIYMSIQPPSQRSIMPTSGIPSELEKSTLTTAETEPGRQNFAVVQTNVHWMEWLWLNGNGHRRAVFTYTDGALIDSSWLIP